ncbi:DUF3352 domain-containing protein [Phormidium sp. FACHB-592]|uniref:DUF3352 domain-containing protein n=1 Tax=Stenomitos frigidus AS-A4 TaxID=2933935 RepID=A0ABV0KCC5_9CYAN|nr:DUF3352 domain-containing protein [Phormidium sp. FACHB-592]MBD2077507.1 DUF3352 domain-containing protein [Phormidium sp. FACHB-592]
MKFRSFLTVLAVVVLVLLLSSAGGFYWLVGRNPSRLLSNEQGSVPGAAIFVPKQAPVMASLLLNPDQLEAFQLVSTRPAERRKVRQELAQLKQSLLATTGLDYERDVQPWLGQEITLAVTTLDIDRDTANGQQPGYLMAIATQEPQRSREFLELFWQKRAIAGSDLVFEQYKGVKIIAAKASAAEPESVATARKPKPSKYRLQLEEPSAPPTAAPLPTLASAAVGDRFILFANHPKVLREAINNVQAPDLSLERSTVFTQAITALIQPRVALTFIDVPKLTQLLGKKLTAQAVQPKTATNTTGTLEKSPTLNQTLIVGFAPNQYGLLAETALLASDRQTADNDAETKTTALPLLAQPVGALQYMPSSSAIAASGADLDRLWTQLTNGLAPYKTAAQILEQPLQALQTRWQLDISADVFSWAKGEYALAMVPPDPISAPGKQPDWLFAAQRPQTEAGQQAIAHLDDLAKQQGLNVGPLTIGDRTVSAWTRLTAATNRVSQPLNLQADVQGVHASLGNYELFATSVAAMDTALKASEHPLLTDRLFQQATASLLQPNNGYLYFDWAASQTFLEQRFPVLKVLELAGKPLFSHLRSLTLSSYGEQAGVQRGGALIQLEQR